MNQLGYAKFTVSGTVFKVPINENLSSRQNEVWTKSVKETDHEKSTVYRNRPGGFPHCFFGPAVIRQDGISDWYLFGNKVKKQDLIILKSILSDVYLAPTYINHVTFKYTAKWVLENYKKET